MTERDFPEVVIPYGDSRVKALKIACSECDGVAYFPHANGPRLKPPSAAIHHFHNKNWVVGSNPRKDLCPIHAKPSRRKGTKPMAETKAPAADKPRQMTRDDRRIVFDKINGVYDGGTYIAPWSDAAVAKDLGIPRDWVSSVREEFFGPAGSNPLFDEYLEKQRWLAAEAATVSELTKKAEAAAQECRKAFNALMPKLDELRLLGKRIEREIGR